MNLNKLKIKLRECLCPALMVGMICLLTAMPSRRAQASCNGDACQVCGDGVLCTDPALCTVVEQCDTNSGKPFLPECPVLHKGDDPVTICLSDTCQLKTCNPPTAPLCGDGFCDPGETCETPDKACGANPSGRTVDCRSGAGGDCHWCGDGVKQDGEECDDGNNVDDDDCSNTCRSNVCGNGRIDVGEECDGNVGSCGEDEQCVNAGLPGECTCKLCPRCGNGQIDQGEQCDDGNNESGDACENDCSLPFCGNGVVDEGEECDAGHDNKNTGLCTADCKLNVCGDGHILTGGEVCDDGNDVNGDGCSDNCQTCPEIRCGNGQLDGDDQCEIGHENECTGDTTCNLNNCKCEPKEEHCGNNHIDSGEECDGSDLGDCENGCEDDCTCTSNECPPDDNGHPQCDSDHKSLICHIPPGNPDNAHTICVDDSAIPAHQAHGDDVSGPCAEECPNDPKGNVTGGGGNTGGASPAAGGCSLVIGVSTTKNLLGLSALIAMAIGLYGLRRRT